MEHKYRMFVDESGDDCMKNFCNLNSEHLCLNGVIVYLNDLPAIENDINIMKNVFFGIDTDINNYPLHRKEIIKCSPPFNSLTDDSIKDEFNSALINHLQAWNFTTITVLIDKQCLIKKYRRPFNPYYFGFALLIERFLIFLKSKRALGDVVAESINSKHDKHLKKLYEHLYHKGVPEFNLDKDEFQKYLSSCQLKMKKKKACIAGLEITDLLVNPLKKEIYKRFYPEKSLYKTFDDDILEVIIGKVLTKRSRLNGIGLKIFP